MSTGTLVPLDNYGPAKFVTDEAFEQIASPGYLPRLQLFGGNSDAVKEGKIDIAHYGLVIAKDQIIDLGKEVDIIPLGLRFKALRFSEGQNVVYYNYEHPEFKKIQAESELPNSGCMYGPEFLVWIPSVKTFASLLLGSKSSRKEGRNVKTLLGNGATMKAKLVSNKSYKWHVPFVIPSSSITVTPESDSVKEQIEKFNNPEESSIEFEPEKLEASRPR